MVYLAVMWLGNSLRQRRQTLGWTIEQAAHHIGIGATYLGKIERNEKVPTLNMLRAIAERYKTPMWVFLYCSDDGVSVDKKVQPAYKGMRASINQVLKELL